MPHRNRPRRGSLQYWPRKRANRIYPRVSYYPESTEIKPLGFAGWKAGMTHVQYVDNNSKSPTFGKVITKAATVVDAPSMIVCGIRFYKKGAKGLKSIGELWTDKIPKGIDVKRNNFGKSSSKKPENADKIMLIVSTQPARSGMKKKKTDFFELGIGGNDLKKMAEYAESMLGKEIAVKDIFKAGEYIDVSAVTKGYGFTGPVKRYGIRIQTRKDKQMHRHVGSLGSTTPRKVDWRVPQAGQYGFFTRTETSKKLLVVEENSNNNINPKGGFLSYGPVPSSYILIEGSVPGPRKRLIRFRKTTREKSVQPIEIKSVSTDTKQGD